MFQSSDLSNREAVTLEKRDAGIEAEQRGKGRAALHMYIMQQQ